MAGKKNSARLENMHPERKNCRSKYRSPASKPSFYLRTINIHGLHSDLGWPIHRLLKTKTKERWHSSVVYRSIAFHGNEIDFLQSSVERTIQRGTFQHETSLRRAQHPTWNVLSFGHFSTSCTERNKRHFCITSET